MMMANPEVYVAGVAVLGTFCSAVYLIYKTGRWFGIVTEKLENIEAKQEFLNGDRSRVFSRIDDMQTKTECDKAQAVIWEQVRSIDHKLDIVIEHMRAGHPGNSGIP